MADRVQFILDRMAVTFREMEQYGVFTQEEVKSVVKKRTDYEYRLRRRQQTPSDYYGYLQYELGLEELRELRCQKMRLGEKGEDEEGEGELELSKELINKHRKLQSSFMKHISYVFERALRRFPDNMDMWNDYISFLQDKKAHATLNTVFGRALCLHPQSEALWLQAAVFEINGNSNAHAARVLLQRALRVNKHSQKLWQTYFELELWYIARGQERKRLLGLKRGGAEGGPSEDGGDHLGVPWVVYRHATKNITGLQFAVSLLKATGLGRAFPGRPECGANSSSSSLQTEIQADIRTRFSGQSEYWAAVVQLSVQESVEVVKQQQKQQQVVAKKQNKKRALSGEEVRGGQVKRVEGRLRAVAKGLADCQHHLQAAACPTRNIPLSLLALSWGDSLAELLPLLSLPVTEDVSLSSLELYRSRLLSDGREGGCDVVQDVLSGLRAASVSLQLMQEVSGDNDSDSDSDVMTPLVLCAQLEVASAEVLLNRQYSASPSSSDSLGCVISRALLWLKSSPEESSINEWSVLATKCFRACSILSLLEQVGCGDSMKDLCSSVLSRGAQLVNIAQGPQLSTAAAEALALLPLSSALASDSLKTRVFAQAVEGRLQLGSEEGFTAVQQAMETSLLGRKPSTVTVSTDPAPGDAVYVDWLLRYTQLSLLYRGEQGWCAACVFVEQRCLDTRPHCVATLSLHRYYTQVVSQGMSLLRSASNSLSSPLRECVDRLIRGGTERCGGDRGEFLEAAEELQRQTGQWEEANHTRWKRVRAV